MINTVRLALQGSYRLKDLGPGLTLDMKDYEQNIER